MRELKKKKNKRGSGRGRRKRKEKYETKRKSVSFVIELHTDSQDNFQINNGYSKLSQS